MAFGVAPDATGFTTLFVVASVAVAGFAAAFGVAVFVEVWAVVAAVVVDFFGAALLADGFTVFIAVLFAEAGTTELLFAGVFAAEFRRVAGASIFRIDVAAAPVFAFA